MPLILSWIQNVPLHLYLFIVTGRAVQLDPESIYPVLQLYSQDKLLLQLETSLLAIFNTNPLASPLQSVALVKLPRQLPFPVPLVVLIQLLPEKRNPVSQLYSHFWGSLQIATIVPLVAVVRF